jgi:hypothetical protein
MVHPGLTELMVASEDKERRNQYLEKEIVDLDRSAD